MLKDFVERIRPVYEALSGCGSEILTNIRNVNFRTSSLTFSNFLQLCEPEVVNPIEDLIKGAINEDVKYARAPVDLRNQRVYAVNVSQSCPTIESLLKQSRLVSMVSSISQESLTRKPWTTHTNI